MNPNLTPAQGAPIEHSGVVQRIANGRIQIAVSVSGCDSCGHGSACGMAKLARQSTGTSNMEFALKTEQSGDFQAGDSVTLRMAEGRSSLFAIIGYLIPALALLVGAAVGDALGSDYGNNNAGTAIGASLGFGLALLLVRFAAGRLPWLLPQPQLLKTHSPLPKPATEQIA